MHARYQFLVGPKLLWVIEKQYLVIFRKGIHIVHPHFQRIHAAVQHDERLAVLPAV